ncbi:MAG: hypothetical protein HYU85_08230 [Chloroflexi bacterium]|nr:hypothetical protein [Chloroflexota bacterium]
MRKRTWLVALLLLGVLVVALGATTAFAQEPVAPDGETWEEMHQACANGDYEAMAEWHTQCHGEESTTSGGMMGGGMMGRGTTGGMMGGGMMGGW